MTELNSDRATGADVAADPAPATEPAPIDEVSMTDTPVTATSFGAYVQAWGKRVRHGESGMLPVLVGLIIIVIIFQVQSSVFLSPGNLTNLLVQGATFVLIGMAEVFVLLLGEIDLSAGYVAGVGAVVAVALSESPTNWPWWLAIIVGLGATTAIAGMQGLLITRLRLPSFVVTLAGLLGWQGVLIFLTDNIGGAEGGTLRITNPVIYGIVNDNMSPLLGWIVLVVCVLAFGVYLVQRNLRRRSAGLVTEPMLLTVLKIAMIAIAGLALVLICNADRGLAIAPVRGIPWVVPIVLAVLAMWTFLLGRTRFGRYVYAIGGNAEAARRAGVNLNRIRLGAFLLTGLTAGIGGIVYASRLGSISSNIDGGQLVLFAVAAAVIGGTSLFGGRGKMLHALVGGIVIAAIYNGMGLVGLSAADQLMVTALVLLAAVVVDAVARRDRAA